MIDYLIVYCILILVIFEVQLESSPTVNRSVGWWSLGPVWDPDFFHKSLLHQKESYYFIVLNKIYL